MIDQIRTGCDKCQMINLRPYQSSAKSQIYDEWNKGKDNVLLVLPTGAGKCLGRNTLILMYDGSIKKVQDIKVGEKLMGPDSKPRHVKSICRGVSPLYRIKPIKGDSWVCNDAHILTLKHTTTKNIIDIPIKDYLEKSKNFKHLHKQFKVGVEFKSKRTWIDPYVLGLYLAEGTYSSSAITTPEPEIKQYLQEWCKGNGMKLKATLGRGCETIHISDHVTGWNKNKIKKLRISCTTKSRRWIPEEFKINSRECRLKLLAGLLDGDGYHHKGSYEIITKYVELKEDILFLAKSLGYAAQCTYAKKEIKSLNFKGYYHRISITGDMRDLPMLVERKKPQKRKQIKDVLNTGFTVQVLEEGEYYGFEITGDGRFVLGDFTVTHNTKCFCSIAIDLAVTPQNKTPTVIMVHRKELVQQISLTLAEEGIIHNIISPRKSIRDIIASQRKMFGKQYYDYMAPITVLSVDTLNARIDKHKKWADTIKLWITDEAHHILEENKWGKAVSYFKNAKGLGVTATPERLDKKGLGRHADGVFDSMVEGPDVGWLIHNDYLSKYKIACPQSTYNDFLKESKGNSDYTKQNMNEAALKSTITGDVVENYLKFANGKQTILFAPGIESAERMKDKYLEGGVKAVFLSSQSSDQERIDGIISFRERKIQVLINVDLFDEGFDVPGIECVQIARPTQSLSKYRQMVGRGLRILEGKPFCLIIDHVDNWRRHDLPDKKRVWTLDRISKTRKPKSLNRICLNPLCASPYDRAFTVCPWCGTEVQLPKGNGGGRVEPEQVDGDLILIDPYTLDELEKATVLEDPEKLGDRVARAAGRPAAIRAMRNQQERIDTQKKLSNIIAYWAGGHRTSGYDDRSIHKLFYIDLSKTISQALAEKKIDMEKTIQVLEKGMGYETT